MRSLGRVVTTPNGRIVADQFWYGDADITYDEIRTDNRFNIDMSIRREFALPSGMRLEVGADAMNILNHTQFSGAYTGGLGGTVTDREPGSGPRAGHGERQQLRHAWHGDVQSAADHAARYDTVLTRASDESGRHNVTDTYR